MASKGTQRKLTAILCADVADYSRLMGADEEATIETLTTYREVLPRLFRSFGAAPVAADLSTRVRGAVAPGRPLEAGIPIRLQ